MIRLDDDTLARAGAHLVQAAHDVGAGFDGRPRDLLESLTGIGPIVTRHLEGIDVARFSLSDAARTTSKLLASLMSESTQLDHLIAEQLGSGFAVPGGAS